MTCYRLRQHTENRFFKKLKKKNDLFREMCESRGIHLLTQIVCDEKTPQKSNSDY